MSPLRALLAVVLCALVMIGCAAAVLRGAWWCAFGIPVAPLVFVGLTCRR